MDDGAEAAIHAMIDIDIVLLIDVGNVFNSINRRVMLHNLKCICPTIAVTKSTVIQLHQDYILSVEER